MGIIELSEMQFKNYSNIHSKRNYLQTINFDKFTSKGKYKGKYLGLLDDDNNVIAAVLIIYENLKNKSKVGYVPGGFLIDLSNYGLLSDFMKYLMIYLKEKNYIYIRVTPVFPYKIYDRDVKLIASNVNLYENLKSVGANFTIFQNLFSKYDSYLEVNSRDPKRVFASFSSSTRRKINRASLMGIKVIEGTKKDFNVFFDLIRDRTDKDIGYYRDLCSSFNNIVNKAEIYFAKIDTKNYLNNYIYLEKREREVNDRLNIMLSNGGSKRVLSKKMKSDQRIARYKNEIVKATDIYKRYPDGLILSTCLIIRNDREVWFLADGFSSELKDIYSLSTLKWEIVKKYLHKGYKKFNFGELHESLNDEKSKYFGLYLHKSGLGNRIYEYTSSYDIIVNKYLYTIYAGVNSLISSLGFNKK